MDVPLVLTRIAMSTILILSVERVNVFLISVLLILLLFCQLALISYSCKDS